MRKYLAVFLAGFMYRVMSWLLLDDDDADWVEGEDVLLLLEAIDDGATTLVIV